MDFNFTLIDFHEKAVSSSSSYIESITGESHTSYIVERLDELDSELSEMLFDLKLFKIQPLAEDLEAISEEIHHIFADLASTNLVDDNMSQMQGMMNKLHELRTAQISNFIS
ncbi:MAG: hypothetical protein LLF94_03030 [Chlamydiales bacterium]|nr:hypothetical protein [Chlamydiales bacterium]